jgi:hypothetical protein
MRSTSRLQQHHVAGFAVLGSKRSTRAIGNGWSPRASDPAGDGRPIGSRYGVRKDQSRGNLISSSRVFSSRWLASALLPVCARSTDRARSAG